MLTGEANMRPERSVKGPYRGQAACGAQHPELCRNLFSKGEVFPCLVDSAFSVGFGVLTAQTTPKDEDVGSRGGGS